MTRAVVLRTVEQRDPDGVGPLDDVEIGQDMAGLVDDESRAAAGGRLVAEEARLGRLGGDVDHALVHRGVDLDVVPLVGVEALEHVLRRRRHGGREPGTRAAQRAGHRAGRGRDRLWGGGDRLDRSAADLRQRRAPQPQAVAEEHRHQDQRHQDGHPMRQDRPPTRRDRSFPRHLTPSGRMNPTPKSPCPARPAARGPAASVFAGFPQIIIARTGRTIGRTGRERREIGRNPNSGRCLQRGTATRCERAASRTGRPVGGLLMFDGWRCRFHPETSILTDE